MDLIDSHHWREFVVPHRVLSAGDIGLFIEMLSNSWYQADKICFTQIAVWVISEELKQMITENNWFSNYSSFSIKIILRHSKPMI